MTQPVPASPCGRLVDALAELSHQLRHFSADPQESRRSPAVVARLAVNARLIEGLGLDSDQCDLQRFGGLLKELVDKWTSVPEAYPRRWNRPLEFLADWLDRLLARADAGASPESLAWAADWEAARVLFLHAGTPLEILDEVESLIWTWQQNWGGDRHQGPVAESLLRGWEEVDVLARRILGGVGEAGAGEGSWRLALLIESPLRRNQLQESLQGQFPGVSALVGPQEAIPWVNKVPGRTAILCDNIEPSNNLRTLRKLLVGAVFRSELPRLVLVAAGGEPQAAALQRRAEALGAWGVWSEPYAAAHLTRLLR